jgi:ATP-dependent DNA helicase RecG
MHAYEDDNVKPQIETTDNAFKITLPNLNYRISSIKFSQAEQTILALFTNQNAIGRKDVEAELQIGQTAAGRLLRQLAKSGVLKVSGTGKNTRYVLAK